jgi:hypothetical protein
LGRLLEASLALYDADMTTPEIPLLTERGYHFLQMLSVLFELFGEDPTFEPYRRRCRVVLEDLVHDLLHRYEDGMPRRVPPVDYVIAAHVLEYIFDDAYYKQEEVRHGRWGFDEPLDVGERAVLQNLALIERRVERRSVLGYAFAMHTLHALQVTEEALRP